MRRENLLRPSFSILSVDPLSVAEWERQEEMRTLGTVQLPTEAFMAVLKLDEE